MREPAHSSSMNLRALALAVAFAQLMAIAHGALAVHQACLEHGEWIERADEHVEAPHAGHEASEPTSISLPSSVSLSEHAHCPALLGRRETAATSFATEIVLRDRIPGHVAFARAIRLVVLRELFRTAPKQSPTSFA